MVGLTLGLTKTGVPEDATLADDVGVALTETGGTERLGDAVGVMDGDRLPGAVAWLVGLVEDVAWLVGLVEAVGASGD